MLELCLLEHNVYEANIYASCFVISEVCCSIIHCVCAAIQNTLEMALWSWLLNSSTFSIMWEKKQWSVHFIRKCQRKLKLWFLVKHYLDRHPQDCTLSTACMFYIRFWLKALLSQSPASQYCKANFITKKLLMHVPCVDSLSLLSLQPKSDERAP